MPFARPTLPTLIERTTQDAAARLSLAGPLLPVSNVAILARVLSGAVHGLYGYLDWLSNQLFADTCEAEHLDRAAGLMGLERAGGVASSGLVDLSGSVGATLAAGAQLRRSDGALYQTTEAATLNGFATAAVQIEALDVGAAGDMAEDEVLSLVAATSGISARAEVAAGGLTGGAAAESDDALRARLLARLRQPPQGGAESDYVAWALAADARVTRAWCYPLAMGAGTVAVRLMSDDATEDGIPESELVALVQAYIDERRPVTAAVTVAAPVADPLALTLTITPDTPATRTAVTEALTDLIRTECEPGGTLLLSHIRAAISAATGEADHVLAVPAANVTAATGHIQTLGTITWE